MPLAQYIKLEQTRALYRRFTFVLLGTAGVSILTVAVLWNNFSRILLLGWLAVALLLVVARWLSSRPYANHVISTGNQHKALQLFTLWAFIAGLTWGLVPLLFFDADKPIYALFITSVYAGYIATVAASTALYLPVFLAFSIAPTLLFAGRVLYAGGEIYTPMSLMILFYYSITIVIARGTYQAFLESKTLNHENLALLEEVREQKDKAEQAIRAKNEFLAAASHDLRQPLHAMGLFIDTLKPGNLSEEQASIVDKISQSRQALNDLLHGLLDISRLDAGVVENRPLHASLARLLEKLQTGFEPDARAKNVQLQIANAEAPAVFIDIVLLERILRNTIDNAIKYTEAGSITLSLESDKDHVTIGIRDTGIGIDKHNIDKVFSEFHQLNNPERDRKKGMGLGLAIVRRLCELTRIQFRFESRVGHGTSLYFTLPSGDAAQIITKPARGRDKPGGCKVLLIDDEASILDAMDKLLHSWGCQLICAESLAQARQTLLARNFKPDVILADFRLREGRNGLDAIHSLREEFNQEIPAILITGDTAPERLRAANKENVTVLYKPVEPGELAQLLNRLS